MRVPLIALGVVVTNSSPTVIFPVSLTSRVVAAMIQRQAGHPWATRYFLIQAGLAPAFNWTRVGAQ